MSVLKKETAAAYGLIYRFPLFDYADENGVINACIAGIDGYCEEFLKAAVWSTQCEGFFLKLDIYTDRAGGERLKREYPELFCTKELSDKNEIFYDIALYDEVFPENKSYGFVFSSGRFHNRVKEAVKSAKKAVIIAENGFSSDFGENTYVFSEEELDGEKFLKESGIEELALRLFCGFNGDSSEQRELFFKNDFYYRSSVASMLFWSLRKKQGADISESTENMKLEHRRWNAFTRTEGYRFGEIRNDREKIHPCLVAWDMLDMDIQQYDLNPIRVINKQAVDKPHKGRRKV